VTSLLPLPTTMVQGTWICGSLSAWDRRREGSIVDSVTVLLDLRGCGLGLL
jgi:hypothetical protein